MIDNKYKKPVGSRTHIDVYDVCDIWQVDDPSGAIQHAVKKLLCNGERGYKPAIQDYREAIGSIQRKIEMMEAGKSVFERAADKSPKQFIPKGENESLASQAVAPTIAIPPRTPVIGEDVSFDAEHRMDPIGQNGNNGEHYPQNGKPSWDDAPDWAKWLAQDETGDWFWYERKPENADDAEFWFSDYEFELASDDEENQDWRETLEARPQ